MKAKTIQNENPEPGIIGNGGDCKTCPYCGQGKIPFKLGVCICGRQVGNVQYVRDIKKFVKNYYSYIGDSSINGSRCRPD